VFSYYYYYNPTSDLCNCSIPGNVHFWKQVLNCHWVFASVTFLFQSMISIQVSGGECDEWDPSRFSPTHHGCHQSHLLTHFLSVPFLSSSFQHIHSISLSRLLSQFPFKFLPILFMSNPSGVKYSFVFPFPTLVRTLVCCIRVLCELCLEVTTSLAYVTCNTNPHEYSWPFLYDQAYGFGRMRTYSQTHKIVPYFCTKWYFSRSSYPTFGVGVM
jgi:hypothetical protein